jgi:hypothetical protein
MSWTNSPSTEAKGLFCIYFSGSLSLDCGIGMQHPVLWPLAFQLWLISITGVFEAITDTTLARRFSVMSRQLDGARTILPSVCTAPKYPIKRLEAFAPPAIQVTDFTKAFLTKAFLTKAFLTKLASHRLIKIAEKGLHVSSARLCIRYDCHTMLLSLLASNP